MADAIMDDAFDDGVLYRNARGQGEGFTDGSSRNGSVRESDGALILYAARQEGPFGAALAVSKNTFGFWNNEGATFHFTVKSLPPCLMDRKNRIRGLVLGVVSAEGFEIGTDCPGLGLDFPSLDKISSPHVNVSLLDDDEDGKVEGVIAVEYPGHFTNKHGEDGRVAWFEFDEWDGSTSMTVSLHVDKTGCRFDFGGPVTFTTGTATGPYPKDFPSIARAHAFAGYKSLGGEARVARIRVEGATMAPPRPLQTFLDDDFSSGPLGGLPEGWSVTAANPALAPTFKLAELPGARGGKALMAEGNGREECFGYVQRKVHVSGGSYRYRVRFKIEGIEDVNRNLLHGYFGDFNQGILHYRKEKDGWIVGESRFVGRPGGDAWVRFHFRFSPHGKVWWDHVLLQEVDPIPPRLVKIAVSSGTHGMDSWAKWLDLAGEREADVALLPEMFNGKGTGTAELIDGPSGTLLSEKAKQWKMYVSGTFYEKRGDLVYNTAPLYDRAGKLVGAYEKIEPYDPEIDGGCSPGRELRVFDADFGKVGTMICYDSWHPEVCRILAYKGAELILFPNAGYYMGLMPARAADSGVWIAVSTCGPYLGIWDSGGIKAGDAPRDPSQGCETSVTDYLDDPENHMFIATVDLNMRLSPHNWGGPFGSAPGGRRVRQTTLKNLEDELVREAKRWHDKP
jgi:predicted amidohydrolase